MTLTYDKLTLFEKVLYHEAVGDHLMPPEPVGYADIEYIADSGWIARSNGLMLHPLYYCPAPLNPEWKPPDNVETLSSLRAKTLNLAFKLFSPSFHVEPIIDGGDRPQSAHQKPTAASFGGQDQDRPLRKKDKWWLNKTTPPAEGYWYEHVYKTIKGKTYGPYLVQRWRDENGKKRSRYLGKVPKEPAAPGQPDLGQPPHSASDSVDSSAPSTAASQSGQSPCHGAA